jgi:hypothetical protein
MSHTLRVALCLLSLSFVNPALVRSQTVSNSAAASEVVELAAALARAGSEEETKGLLGREKGPTNG